MTVAELSDRLSYRELLEWMAYYELEPWGAERDDLRSGISTAAIVQMWAGKNARKIKPTMFMPYYEPPKKQAKTPEQMRATFDALMSKGG